MGWWYISKLYKKFLEIVWFHCDQVPLVIEDNAGVAAEVMQVTYRKKKIQIAATVIQ